MTKISLGPIFRYMAKYKNITQELVKIFRALGDLSRLRVFNVLQGRELCVCQIVKLLGLAPSTVSKHMAVLKQANLVCSRKDGRWIYYRLSDLSADQISGQLAKLLERSLSMDRQGAADRKRVDSIVKCPLEEVCQSWLRK